MSAYGNAIIRHRKKQELLSKPYTGKDIHPLLVGTGDIDPLPVVEIPGLEGLSKREIEELDEDGLYDTWD